MCAEFSVMSDPHSKLHSAGMRLPCRCWALGLPVRSFGLTRLNALPASAAAKVWQCGRRCGRLRGEPLAVASLSVFERAHVSPGSMALPPGDAEVHTVAGHPEDLGEVFPDRLHHAYEQGKSSA